MELPRGHDQYEEVASHSETELSEICVTGTDMHKTYHST
jgi:hypothetical protein